ncbi:MAG: homocysteine S-methyltransferase family protein [Caldilineaceae bacterium]|nr:homocysteine S-methyltransferase family protein [Caldilineaceae bacterium]
MASWHHRKSAWRNTTNGREIEPRYRKQTDLLAPHVAQWLVGSATIVDGGCGTRPAHIAHLRRLLDSTTIGM